MSHPHKGQAQNSSRSKMRSMTGHAGGGHAHAGASHFLKTKQNGVIKSEHPSRRKSGGHVPGAGAKPRLDKYARGGRAEGGRAKKGDVNVAIVMPHHQQPGMPVPPLAPASPLAGGAPPPSGASPMGAMGALGSQAGQQALGALTGGTGSNPLAGLSRGFKKGGRAKMMAKSMPVESFQNDGGFSGSGYNGGDYSPTGDKRGGRHAKGGRTKKRDDGGQAEGPPAPKTQPGSYGSDQNADVPNMITRGMHSIGIPFNWPGSTESEMPKPSMEHGQTRAPEKRAKGGSIGQRGYHSKSVGTVENGDHLDHWEGYAEKNRNEYTPPYPRTKDSSALARGGRTGGAQTGVGRLEGAAEARRNTKKGK